MSRPWHTWLAFVCCLAVVLAAMGWVSATVLELDRGRAESRRRDLLEENVRLALWRMDSALSPIVAQESVRPYSEYEAFYRIDRAYSRTLAELDHGEVFVPSALMTEDWAYVLMHFQIAPSGRFTSPKVPTGDMRNLAEGGYITLEQITTASERLDELQGLVSRDTLLAALSAPADSTPYATMLSQADDPEAADRKPFILSQGPRNTAEWQNRVLNFDNNGMNISQARQFLPRKTIDVSEGRVEAVWIGDDLLLARRVLIDGQELIQGCWLDWPGIRNWQLREVRDLLPDADLVPRRADPAGHEGRLLAALPVRVVPGEIAADFAEPVSPVRVSLWMAWGCVLLAAVAVAVLLRGTLVLSERRATFVSSVTHEMRTPLTTFRMYTEMLLKGMVPDEEKRKRYLHTLRVEADRLGHLVENVLAYARLERKPAGARLETISLQDLLEGMADRLADRTAQADMQLVVEADDGSADLKMRTDTSAVEQILFNLVDNACKYAADADERLIHLEAGRNGSVAVLRVRDHGPGITDGDGSHLFRPFSKSARQAANSASGVGLGLALSRRLARNMKGDLRLDPSVTDGACFQLTLPVV